MANPQKKREVRSQVRSLRLRPSETAEVRRLAEARKGSFSKLIRQFIAAGVREASRRTAINLN